MKTFVRTHISWVTAVLSAIALALVFAAVRGFVPPSLLPHASETTLSVIPTANAVISFIALVTISLGWWCARERQFKKHRAAMLASFVLFVLFLTLYLYKVSLEGPTEFPGPEVVYTYLYLPVLAIHMVLAVICIPLLFYVLLLAGTHSIEELPSTPHPRVGRIAAGLWLVSFALGIVVYLLLYVVY